MVKVTSIRTDWSVMDIRDGHRMLTNEVEPGVLVPGFGLEDPNTH